MDDVADNDPDGGFITAHMNGFGEPSFGPFSVRNWNTSRDDGPLGPPCVLPRPILACFQRLNLFEKLKKTDKFLNPYHYSFNSFPVSATRPATPADPSSPTTRATTAPATTTSTLRGPSSTTSRRTTASTETGWSNGIWNLDTQNGK